MFNFVLYPAESILCATDPAVELARLWWRALRDANVFDENLSAALLSRDDMDWEAQLLYLSQCGLCGPLLPALDHPIIQRHAPVWWQQKMALQARVDTLRSLLQEETLREIAAAAREVGAPGILLKGGAMLALESQTTGQRPARACCDLDVYFAPGVAERVHARLLQREFSADDDGLNVETRARHQLPGLVKDAVSVEIHQSLLPLFCGAPERAMRRGTVELRAPELRGLRVLSPEAMLLHSALHCSKHLWTHGLKVAYDTTWICERFPGLNWNWLARLVARTGMKRGFWVPVSILARELSLPLPATVLRRAPRDARQSKLERVAGRTLWNATRAEFQDNPWLCHPLYLLQSDSWSHRAHHLLDLSVGDYAIAMRQQRNAHDPAHRRSRWNKLHRAARAWREW